MADSVYKTMYDAQGVARQNVNTLSADATRGLTLTPPAGVTAPIQTNGIGQAITPSALTPSQPITPVVAQQTPPPDVSSLQSQIDTINKQYAEPLPNEAQIDPLRQSIMDITNQLAGEVSDKATLEADPAIQAQRQQVQDLTNQANALIAEQKAIPIRLQQEALGKGMTAGGLAPIQTAQLRNNAIQALSVSSLLSAAQGNLSLALDQVDRAVKAKYEPLKAQLDAKRANLEMLLNDPAISRETQRRAEIAKTTLAFQERVQAKQEADDTAKLNLATKLAGYGVDSNILKHVQGARTFDEAFSLATPYMQDPASKLELENAKLDYKIKQQELAYKAKQTELLGQPTPAKQEKIELAKKNAKVAVEVANDQVATIDGLLNDQALQYAVGPTETDRQGMLLGIPYVAGVGSSIPALVNKGQTQNFIASVDQLVSQGTLDTLLNLKKAGGTLGALSDQERTMLRSAFSKIGQWEIEDPKTKKVVGYAVDEDSFKRELQTIKALSQKAAVEASGEALDTATSSEIDALLGTQMSDEELLNLMQ